MTKALGVGIIGCGNISTTYFTLAPLFKAVELRACADLSPQAAQAQAESYGVKALSIDELLSAQDIDIIVNLTVPAAHFEVSKAILEAGKHVYSEKPFCLTAAEGKELGVIAEQRGLRIASAPDTFLGGTHQHARALIDQGDLGKITSGTCHVMSHGMEAWHPNPAFFFKPGGGPVLDLGPYYITNLVQLLGPVTKVGAMSSIPAPERTITSQPLYGQKIEVETPTTIHALLQFTSGAIITLGASWDVWQNNHKPMELYGEAGTLLIPDPNFFGGDLSLTNSSKEPVALPEYAHAFAVNNHDLDKANPQANYRGAGLADLAEAIMAGRPHRCSFEMALHVVEIMTAILTSGETGAFQELTTTCERPQALTPQVAEAMLAAPVTA
ncbi:Gfo/Idh/MocA family protein [Polycladidibacter hongkongensis]|uniref:Gfo/Idh/MocA family protein n=1 Tax=Polycladidibacter hongkongensis TaxID=1647556 RepID=UPI000834697A|nr:Gfo/Idh/MocA family oxidoreductase [Pseudovibrio hongkongensis]